MQRFVVTATVSIGAQLGHWTEPEVIAYLYCLLQAAPSVNQVISINVKELPDNGQPSYPGCPNCGKSITEHDNTACVFRYTWDNELGLGYWYDEQWSLEHYTGP